MISRHIIEMKDIWLATQICISLPKTFNHETIKESLKFPSPLDLSAERDLNAIRWARKR
jgi:hypothetical protein